MPEFIHLLATAGVLASYLRPSHLCNTGANRAASTALIPPQGARARQQERVNGIARRLLARGNGRGKLDASYLLDTRRRRRLS